MDGRTRTNSPLVPAHAGRRRNAVPEGVAAEAGRASEVALTRWAVFMEDTNGARRLLADVPTEAEALSHIAALAARQPEHKVIDYWYFPYGAGSLAEACELLGIQR